MLELRIAGAEEPYAGVNVEFVLPQGVTVLGVERGAVLPESFQVDTHSFVEDEQTVQTALAYAEPDSAASGDGCLLVFTLQVTGDLSAIGLEEIEFVHAPVVMTASGIAGSDWQTSEPHAALSGTITLCKHDGLPLMVVTPAGANVPSSGSEVSFSVLNSGLGDFEWRAAVAGGGGWVHMTTAGSGVSGGAFCVVVDPNSGEAARSATVVVEADGILGSPVTVAIHQGINEEPVLAVAPETLEGPATSGLDEISIANAGGGALNWTARVISGIDWVSITSATAGTGDGVVTIARLPNLTPVARTAVVEISAPDAEGSPAHVTLTQLPPPVLAVNPQEQTMGCEGGTAEFAVANAGSGALAWTAQVVSGGDWLHVAAGESGVDEGVIAAEAGVNPNADARVGRIQVVSQGSLGSPVEVVVIQAGDKTPLLSIEPGTRSVSADACMAEFSVTNAGNGTLHWSASVVEGGAWASIGAGMTGVNAGGISVSCHRNDTAAARTAVVRVEADGADGSPKELTITQEARQPLTLTEPNGGEWWKRGSTHMIRWTSGPSVASVSIVLMKGGNVARMVTLSTSNSGSHEWTIPADIEPGRDYQVQVISVADPTVHDECDADFAINCPPEPPANLTATTSARSRVILTWEPVDTATAYEVYRCEPDSDASVLIATVNETKYVDRDVRSWRYSGCSMTRNAYIYSVRTVNGCDAGDFSEEVEGMPESLLKSGVPAPVYERVLPRPTDDDGERPVASDAALAIRIRATDDIDPLSIWATVECASECVGATEWIPADEDTRGTRSRDGWVVYVPAKPWAAGDLITMTVGGATYAGAAIEPVTYAFRVAQEPAATEPAAPAVWQPPYTAFDTGVFDLSAEGNDLVTVYTANETDTPVLDNGTGAPYVIGPPQVWKAPQRVWLPLPAGQGAEDVGVYYYYAGADAAGWYGAEQVEGWLVDGSLLTAEVDGTAYLGFLVRHGGVVQLGAPPEPAQPFVEAGALLHGAWGDVCVLGLVLLALAWNRRRLRVGKRFRVFSG